METFIVRVWAQPSSSESRQAVRGVVEHVGSARKTTFVDEGELLAFLEEAGRELTAARQAGGAPWGDEGP